MQNSGPDRERNELQQDDEIEILEVVGLEPEEREVPTGRADTRDDGQHEIVLDLDVDGGEEAALREQLLRLRADFENFRKRIDREREAAERHATANLVSRLLPVLDNFERALSLGRDSEADRAFQDGVAMIFRQLLDELRKEGLVAVDSVGEPFNPEVHEAVATAPERAVPAHTVVEELQRGYLLHDRLLRPALVKVSVDPSHPSLDAELQDEDS